MKKCLLGILVLFIIPYQVVAVETSARNAILMDMDSKRILYAKNIHEQKSVASISKIMTAVLAVESGKLDEVVTVGEEIDKSYGSGIIKRTNIPNNHFFIQSPIHYMKKRTSLVLLILISIFTCFNRNIF